MGNNPQQENAELKARLHAFAAIMRLGRDAFEQPDLPAAAVHIVNNSRTLLAYESSSLADLRGNPSLLAEYAQVEVKQHTEYAADVKILCRSVDLSGGAVELNEGNEAFRKLSEKARGAFSRLAGEGGSLLLVPLRSARFRSSAKDPFVWLMTFKGAVPPHVGATIPLLASDYGNALWSHTPRGGARLLLKWLRKITLIRILLLLLAAFVVAMFTVDVEHTVSAEFVVRPDAEYNSYAWFDCVVKNCFFNDGDAVKAGDRILEYDTDRMRFQLAASEAAFKEANAEYEQVLKASFTDRENLGKLKVLAFKRDSAKIAIEEAKWYLAHSVVTAPVSGILAIAEGSADKLAGRALRLGEKQFDILSDKGMIAEIMVNEKDASVLEGNPRITLFLHTRPELPIPVKILSSRFYPELTEQNIYSYNVKAEMENNVPGLRFGMRGVARVTGEKVKLGYYLFRSLVLWYRGV